MDHGNGIGGASDTATIAAKEDGRMEREWRLGRRAMETMFGIQRNKWTTKERKLHCKRLDMGRTKEKTERWNETKKMHEG